MQVDIGHVTTFDISGVNLPLPADMTWPTFAAKVKTNKKEKEGHQATLFCCYYY